MGQTAPGIGEKILHSKRFFSNKSRHSSAKDSNLATRNVISAQLRKWGMVERNPGMKLKLNVFSACCARPAPI